MFSLLLIAAQCIITFSALEQQVLFAVIQTFNFNSTIFDSLSAENVVKIVFTNLVDFLPADYLMEMMIPRKEVMLCSNAVFHNSTWLVG